MKKIIIINGPNLNLLGKREPDIYGDMSFEEFFEEIKDVYSSEIQLTAFQSNIEGELIDKIQEVGFKYDGIILNAGGYTHTSVALRDAVAAAACQVRDTVAPRGTGIAAYAAGQGQQARPAGGQRQHHARQPREKTHGGSDVSQRALDYPEDRQQHRQSRQPQRRGRRSQVTSQHAQRRHACELQE